MHKKNSTYDLDKDLKFIEISDKLKQYCESNDISFMLSATKTDGDQAFVGMGGGHLDLMQLLVITANKLKEAVASELHECTDCGKCGTSKEDRAAMPDVNKLKQVMDKFFQGNSRDSGESLDMENLKKKFKEAADARRNSTKNKNTYN